MNFDIRLFLQSKVHQCLGIVLCRWTLYGGNERLPLSRKLAIRREGGDIDRVLDLANGLLIEGRDAPRQGIDELVELGIRKRAVDVAISFGKVAVDIVAAQQNFERTASPHQAGKTAIGLPLGSNAALTSNWERMAFSRLARRISEARDSSLPTSVARPRIDTIDTTGERLRRTSISGSGGKPVRPGRLARSGFEGRHKVIVGQEEAGDSAVKHDGL
jgi:hypothetical protein